MSFFCFRRPFLLCPVLSRVPSRILAVLARPVPDFSCPGPSRPLARFWACLVVPLSRKVALSRPVGNPTLNYYFWMASRDHPCLISLLVIELTKCSKLHGNCHGLRTPSFFCPTYPKNFWLIEQIGQMNCGLLGVYPVSLSAHTILSLFLLKS